MDIAGAWNRDEVTGFLSSASIPVRLACIGRDGFPRVVALWFRFQDDNLFCVSHRDAPLLGMLRSNPQVGFDVSPNEPPYHGVRGQGTAEIAGMGGEMLELLLARYLGDSNKGLANWLMSRREEEVLVRIAIARCFSWDYRHRMERAG